MGVSRASTACQSRSAGFLLGSNDGSDVLRFARLGSFKLGHIALPAAAGGVNGCVEVGSYEGGAGGVGGLEFGGADVAWDLLAFVAVS